jgi:hypothetical protein
MTDQDIDNVDGNTVLEDISVIDGDRVLEFRGVRIGASSSHTPMKKRWSEIFIYRTEAGVYIVAGVGRSKIEGETDNHWARSYTDPADVIAHLHMTNETNHSKYLPYTNRDAIAQARLADPVFAQARMVEHID